MVNINSPLGLHLDTGNMWSGDMNDAITRAIHDINAIMAPQREEDLKILWVILKTRDKTPIKISINGNVTKIFFQYWMWVPEIVEQITQWQEISTRELEVLTGIAENIVEASNRAWSYPISHDSMKDHISLSFEINTVIESKWMVVQYRMIEVDGNNISYPEFLKQYLTFDSSIWYDEKWFLKPDWTIEKWVPDTHPYSATSIFMRTPLVPKSKRPNQDIHFLKELLIGWGTREIIEVNWVKISIDEFISLIKQL